MGKQPEGRRSDDFAEAAMGLMRSHEIAPVPINYQIWYTYAAGTNKKLNQAIDILLANKREISNTACEDLHYHFFQNPDNATQLTSITSLMGQHLADLTSVLSQAGLDMSNFGHILGDASAMLVDYPQAEEKLLSVINLLSQGTRQMEQRNVTLEQSLQQSNEQMVELQSKLELIREVSLTDQLTEIGNRRAFDERLREYAIQSMETGQPLCLLLLDIDKFKNFNDRWGHSFGDQVLRLVASFMSRTVGDKGFSSRYGGEEFAVLLPNQDIAEAVYIANAIREGISSREIVNRSNGQKVGASTVSIGVAQYAHGEPLGTFVERTDAGLYAAKQNGRNRVVAENELLRLQQC